MDLPPALLQLLGSLVAILALAGLALWLKLGPEPKLESEADARAVAEEAVSGFEPKEVALDQEGRGALLRDATGRILLLRPHGSHFAGRLLTSAARMEANDKTLLIDTSEKRFGTAQLTIDDASAWMQALDAIKERQDA